MWIFSFQRNVFLYLVYTICSLTKQYLYSVFIYFYLGHCLLDRLTNYLNYNAQNSNSHKIPRNKFLTERNL